MYQLLRLFEAGGSHMVALTRPKAAVSTTHQDPAAAAAASQPAAAASQPAAAAAGTHGLARSSSASGALPLHRIKSGAHSVVWIEGARLCVQPCWSQPAS